MAMPPRERVDFHIAQALECEGLIPFVRADPELRETLSHLVTQNWRLAALWARIGDYRGTE